MKNIFRSFSAILTVLALFSCTEAEEARFIESDTVSLDIAAYGTGNLELSIRSNVNWILESPEWIRASTDFGRGDDLVTLSFKDNLNEEIRNGEIRISGGGALDGNGAVLAIPVSQKAYDVDEYLAYLDTCEVIGGIPDDAEFAAFIRAANLGYNLRRWTGENGEVALLSDVDLTWSSVDWQVLVNKTNVTNSANSCDLNNQHKFTGVFDGQNHKITGFNPTVAMKNSDSFGLFTVAEGAVIKNLEVTGSVNVSASGQADAGMLVGTAKNVTISNVKVSGSIISAGTTKADERFAVGGLCGYAFGTADKPTVIENCVSDVVAQVTCGSNKKNGATGAMYGGIVAFATGPNEAGEFVRVSSCVNDGDMTVTLGRCSGLVATANAGVLIENSTNNGNQVNSIANGRLGNLVCYLAKNCSMVNCVNNGNMETTTTYSGTVGGMVALIQNANASIVGGGNYGTIKTAPDLSYYGLIGANLHTFKEIKDVKVGGALWLGGQQVAITSGNFMDYIGKYTDENKSMITGCSYVNSSATE